MISSEGGLWCSKLMTLFSYFESLHTLRVLLQGYVSILTTHLGCRSCMLCDDILHCHLPQLCLSCFFGPLWVVCTFHAAQVLLGSSVIEYEYLPGILPIFLKESGNMFIECLMLWIVMWFYNGGTVALWSYNGKLLPNHLENSEHLLCGLEKGEWLLLLYYNFILVVYHEELICIR